MTFCTRYNIINARAKKRGDELSPRIGRPPKDNPRNINLNIRISKDEANLIQKCADELEMTRTDVIIKGVNLVEKELKK